MNRRSRALRGLVVAWTLFSVGVAHLHGAQRYVDGVFGDDFSGNGSSDLPWRTVTHAVSQLASGDVLRIASGVYDAAHGEASSILIPSGVTVTGAGMWTTRLESTLMLRSPTQWPKVESLTFTGLDVEVSGLDTGFIMKNCVLDLGDDSATITVDQGGFFRPVITDCRLQNVSPRIFIIEVGGGSVLGGAFTRCFYYLGMDGAHLHHIYLTGGSRMSTAFVGNTFEAKQHLGLSFWVGYHEIAPLNTFDSLFLNNTFLASGFHLMLGVSHELQLINNILAGGTDWYQIDQHQVWNNLLVDGPYIGIQGNITGDPLFVDDRNDFRLQPDSPAIDVGELHSQLPTHDQDGIPRILDGDLDGLPRVDIGAHETTHGELEVSGDQRVGGSIRFDLTGTAPLKGFLFLGLQTDTVSVGRWGTLFLSPFLHAFVGTLPVAVDLAIPDSPDLIGLTLYAQASAFSPELDGAGTLGARRSATLLP